MNDLRWLLILAFSVGCGSKTNSPQDMSPSPDMALPTCSTTGGPGKQYVVNSLKMPASSADYAIDLNGDGMPDNKLGDIVSILKTQGIDLQASSVDALEAGELLILLDYQAQTSLDEDSCSQTTISGAEKPAAPPLLDGTDHLTVDNTLQTGVLSGSTHAMLFNSASPLTTTMPTEFTLKIPLAIGSPPVKLHVTAGQGSFVHLSDRLSQGQLHGAVKKTEFDDQVMPALRDLFNAQIQAGTTSAQNILNTFDKGNCMNPDGSMAVAGDNKIDLCEVTQNGLIQLVLAPDVALFDVGGHFSPDPTNNNKDSVSLGLGFTAIGASY